MKSNDFILHFSSFILFFFMNLAIIILAAGRGTRMESDRAKVLHPLCGKPLISHVLESVAPLHAAHTIAIVGHQAADVESHVAAHFPDVEFATQSPMLGTGHAVGFAEKRLSDFDGDVVVMCGDAPLLKTETLRQLIELRRQNNAPASMMVATATEATSYGRVVLSPDGQVQAIVEVKDASPEVLALQTVNAGTYCFDSKTLWSELAKVKPNNAQGEYYLTDVIGFITQDGGRVQALMVSEREITGVNTRAQLQALEAELREIGECEN